MTSAVIFTYLQFYTSLRKATQPQSVLARLMGDARKCQPLKYLILSIYTHHFMLVSSVSYQKKSSKYTT